MKIKKIIPILALITSCSVSRNPYYRMSVGLPHVYFNDRENKVYKIESKFLIEGNTLQTAMPQELGGKNVKGTATYEMEVNKQMEIYKINLVAIRIEDSVSNKFLMYQRYDPANRTIEKPNEQIEVYNKYLVGELMKLKFKKVIPPNNKNKVYCNFIF
jgi:hypothetical protein